MAEIDLLRTFLAVYRTGSFTRAASELHLSQPAVSLQVRSLETRMGRTLFTRRPRGAEPTAAGHELAQGAGLHVDALQVLLGADAAADEPTAAAAASVHLGGPEEFTRIRVLPELAPLVDAGMHLRVRFDVDPPNIQRLRDGELDMAITTAEHRERGFESRQLCYEYLELVAAPGWAHRLRERMEVEDLADALASAPLISYAEDLPLARTWWQAMAGEGPRRRAHVVVNSLRASLDMAVAGAGITVLPAHAIGDSIARGELERVIHADEPPRNTMHLTWRAGALRSATTRRVRDAIVAASTDW